VAVAKTVVTVNYRAFSIIITYLKQKYGAGDSKYTRIEHQKVL